MNAYGFEAIPLGGDYVGSILTVLMLIFIIYNIRLIFTPYKEKKEE